jgi:hypothetical protein
MASMGDGRDTYWVLVRNPEGRKPFCMWKDNIKIDIQEVGLGSWTGFIWLRIWTGGRLL